MLGLSWTKGQAPILTSTQLGTLQTAYVALGWGLFLHFNMNTFLDQEFESGNESENSFDPGATLNIDQWISTAQAAKAKYLALTTKHHGGFCLWPSSATTHDIASSSWYANNGQIDIVSQFTTKCRAAGIAPVLYFSVLDQWAGSQNIMSNRSMFRSYLETQLTELLTNYGAITAIWFDGGEWEFNGTAYPWDSAEQRNRFVHSLQAFCLAIDNAHTGISTDSDIIEYEKVSVTPGNVVPAERCNTIKTDGDWFWKSSQNDCQSASTVLADLSETNGRTATYLLNCPPDNTGNIPSNVVTVLTTVGGSL